METTLSFWELVGLLLATGLISNLLARHNPSQKDYDAKLDLILEQFEGLREYLYEIDSQFDDERRSHREFSDGNGGLFSGMNDMNLLRRKQRDGKRTLSTGFQDRKPSTHLPKLSDKPSIGEISNYLFALLDTGSYYDIAEEPSSDGFGIDLGLLKENHQKLKSASPEDRAIARTDLYRFDVSIPSEKIEYRGFLWGIANDSLGPWGYISAEDANKLRNAEIGETVHLGGLDTPEAEQYIWAPKPMIFCRID